MGVNRGKSERGRRCEFTAKLTLDKSCDALERRATRTSARAMNDRSPMDDHVWVVIYLCLGVIGVLAAMMLHTKLVVQPRRSRELREMKGAGYKIA